MVVTFSAFSTEALSLIEASNCMMIGTATPTTWPSASWNWPFTWVSGVTVVKVPASGTALPSRPTTAPAQEYSTP